MISKVVHIIIKMESSYSMCHGKAHRRTFVVFLCELFSFQTINLVYIAAQLCDSLVVGEVMLKVMSKTNQYQAPTELSNHEPC